MVQNSQSTKSNRVKNLFAPHLPAIHYPSPEPEATTGFTSFFYVLLEMVCICTFYSHFFHINDSILYIPFCNLFFS